MPRPNAPRRRTGTSSPQGLSASPAPASSCSSPADDVAASFARAVADRIEEVPIARLRVFSRRSRTHSEEQLGSIMGSFEAFGFLNPVLVDEDNQILAGHARVEAARRLGYISVPVVPITHLTADEKRAYVIADNRLAEKAGWDREVLAIELKELSQIDLGFELDTIGFSIGEIDLLVGESAPAEEEDDALPAPSAGPAVTQAGDLWQLGRHRLFCGNSLHPASFAALLSGDQARMVLTDPPYNVAIDGFVGGLGAVKHREFAMASGEMSETEFTDFLTSALARMAENVVDGGLLYVFMDWRHEYELMTGARAVGLRDHNLCVWNKLSGGMGSHYRSQHELCRIFKRGSGAHLNTVELGRHGRTRTNVWDHPGLSSFGRGRDDALASHPTVKPVALLAEAIKDATRRGDLVLDPFLGSGSTLIAAERTGRRAAGIELDPLYCDTIIRRFETLTGTLAVHAASGQTFEALRQARGCADDPATTVAAPAPTEPASDVPSPRVRHRPRPSTTKGESLPPARPVTAPVGLDDSDRASRIRVRQRHRAA